MRGDGPPIHHLPHELLLIRDAEIAIEAICGDEVVLPAILTNVAENDICPACRKQTGHLE